MPGCCVGIDMAGLPCWVESVGICPDAELEDVDVVFDGVEAERLPLRICGSPKASDWAKQICVETSIISSAPNEAMPYENDLRKYKYCILNILVYASIIRKGIGDIVSLWPQFS